MSTSFIRWRRDGLLGQNIIFKINSSFKRLFLFSYQRGVFKENLVVFNCSFDLFYTRWTETVGFFKTSALRGPLQLSRRCLSTTSQHSKAKQDTPVMFGCAAYFHLFLQML